MVTSSESGHLLLWEGGLIKCQIGRALVQASATDDVTAAAASAVGTSSPRSQTDGVAALEYTVGPAHDGPVHAVRIERDLEIVVTGIKCAHNLFKVHVIDTSFVCAQAATMACCGFGTCGPSIQRT